VANVKNKKFFGTERGATVKGRKAVIAGLGTLTAAAVTFGLLVAQSMYELDHLSLFP
jgi:hypothetical protein